MYKVFTVFDNQAEAFLLPFFAQNRAVGIRMFTDAVNNPESNFNRHPDHYQLFEIGEWDEKAATWEPYEALEPGPLAMQVLKED